MRSVVVVGGGILGLAVARELVGRGNRVTVLEKEGRWAVHQTGHNSNVVHAGLYYQPGSFKARMSVAGSRSIVDFARANGVAVEVCGKLVVATSEAELPALNVLAERAEANGVPAKLIEPAEAREYEPEVACVAALRVDSTGVIDFPGVCGALPTPKATSTPSNPTATSTGAPTTRPREPGPAARSTPVGTSTTSLSPPAVG